MKTWQYALIVFMGGCSYGVLSTFVKLAYGAGYSMGEVTGSQYLLGAVMMWIAVLFTRKAKWTVPQIAKLLIAGVPLGLTGIFYYQSLQTLNASLAIVFLFQFVWIGTLFEWIRYRRTPSTGKIVSIAVLLLGSVLAAGVGAASGHAVTWEGVAWGLLSAVTFTTSILVSGTVSREVPPVLKSALLSTGGMLIVVLLYPPVFLLDASVATGVLPYGLFLGLFGVALPPLLFSIAMPHVGTGLGTILTASELPTAVLMSSIVLAEHVDITQWLGVALILGGIAVGNAGRSAAQSDAAGQ